MNMKPILFFSAALFATAALWLAAPPPALAQGKQATVLDGVYSEAQATRGKDLYGEKCAMCHEGAEPDGPPLSSSTFIDNWREDTLDTLFTFIRTRMPRDDQGSLTEAQYLDIVASILQTNNFKSGAKDLTADATKNYLVVGENGPQALPANSTVRLTGCFAGSGDNWQLAKAGEPSRTRESNEISDAEIKAATGKSGSKSFRLRNLDNAEGFKPESGAGHNVVLKGVLGKDAINVTAAKVLPSTCTP